MAAAAPCSSNSNRTSTRCAAAEADLHAVNGNRLRAASELAQTRLHHRSSENATRQPAR